MWPIRSLRYMRIAGSPTNRLNGWTMPTNGETPDCLRSKAIRYSRICTTTRDTPNFSRKCACQPEAKASTNERQRKRLIDQLRKWSNELKLSQSLAVSMDRCNTCLEFTGRSFKAQSFSWTLIEAQRYLVEIGLRI